MRRATDDADHRRGISVDVDDLADGRFVREQRIGECVSDDYWVALRIEITVDERTTGDWPRPEYGEEVWRDDGDAALRVVTSVFDRYLSRRSVRPAVERDAFICVESIAQQCGARAFIDALTV